MSVSTTPKTELVPRFRHAAGDYVTALEITRDGELMFAGLGDGSLLALELATGRERFRVTAHDGGVLGVSVSRDGSRIATCGQSGVAKVFDAQGHLESELAASPGSAPWVEHVRWDPAGTRLALAAGRVLRVFDRESVSVFQFDGFESTVTGLAWRADGSGLAASCYGGVRVFPFVDNAKPRHLAWKGSLISLTWSPDAKVIACGSQDCGIHFWRLGSGAGSEISGYRFKPRALAWDHESKLLATAGDADVLLWDFRGKGPEGSSPMQLEGHKGLCTRLAYSATRGLLVSGSQDTSVLLWEPRRSVKPLRFGFLVDQVTALAWEPSQHGVVAADASGTIVAWTVP